MKKLPGIQDVAFDLRTRVATVSFDGSVVSASQVEAVIDAVRRDMAESGQQEQQMGSLLDDS